MRKFSVLSVLIALLLLFTLPISAQESEVRLTLERQPCFGACPVYTITIYADGTVVYNGERFVEVEGEQISSIPPETVDKLVTIFEEAGYFDWDDEYIEQTVTDLPYVTTSVTRDGETKQIGRYEGDSNAPVDLPYLENWIDEIVHSEQWVGQAPPLPYFTSAGQPVITLNRDYCFGMCPVYSLVLHDTGTVVYRGFDHVNEIGIRVGSVDAPLVESLANEMQVFGYFDWQDEYTEYFITDQPTVITSLTWDGQSKRILRYDGDPNAPVGLVRIEDRIDQIANSSQWVN